MSDMKWGFDKNYGHRQLPLKWQASSNFHLYDQSPLLKKSFRESGLPVYMEDYCSRTTSYTERAQDARNNMSAYGCHRNMPWDTSLRTPRNPFPGRPNRETRFVQQPSPVATPRHKLTPYRLSMDTDRSNSAPSTSRRRQQLLSMGLGPSVLQASDDSTVASSYAQASYDPEGYPTYEGYTEVSGARRPFTARP